MLLLYLIILSSLGQFCSSDAAALQNLPEEILDIVITDVIQEDTQRLAQKIDADYKDYKEKFFLLLNNKIF